MQREGGIRKLSASSERTTANRRIKPIELTTPLPFSPHSIFVDCFFPLFSFSFFLSFFLSFFFSYRDIEIEFVFLREFQFQHSPPLLFNFGNWARERERESTRLSEFSLQRKRLNFSNGIPIRNNVNWEFQLAEKSTKCVPIFCHLFYDYNIRTIYFNSSGIKACRFLFLFLFFF